MTRSSPVAICAAASGAAPAGLYCVGNGLVTPGRSSAFRKWFQEVEVRAQLVVVEWKIYFQSRAVAKPGIALAWGAIRTEPSPNKSDARPTRVSLMGLIFVW